MGQAIEKDSLIGNKSYISMTSGLQAKDYIGYALGDTACNLIFALNTTLLQKFYTDIFQLSPIFIMLMMIGARLWDAVNDPIMGRIADSIPSDKTGRYKRWFVWGAIPLALSGILMFSKWPGLGNTPNHVGTAVYATITYVFFGMAYTVVQIPYGSLASVVTTDEKERSKLSTFRSVGAGIGSIPVLLLASFCYKDRVDSLGKKVVGENGQVIQDMQSLPVLIGVLVFCITMVIVFVIAFKLNKERVVTKPSSNTKEMTKKSIKALLGNKSFVVISSVAMLALAGPMFTQSFYLYLFADYFGKGWLTIVATASQTLPILILVFATPTLIKKYGKKELSIIGLFLSAFSYLAMFACRSLMPQMWWLFVVLIFFSGIGFSFISLQMWAMAIDAIDDVEVKSGVREEGTAYAMFMFFRKVGQMIAAVAVNGALIAMRYNYKKGAVQTAANLKTMYDMATIIPAVMYAIMALLLLFVYPLSKKRLEELQEEKEIKLKEAYESDKIDIVI